VAQLDPLLKALVERQAQELVLADGRQPAFRLGEELKPVSQQVLTRSQIAALLAELSQEIDEAALAAGLRFSYSPGDGSSFVCEIDNGDGAFSARLKPESGEAPVAEQPPLSAEGAPEIDLYLRQMVELGASDLHLSPEEAPMIRLHGDMMRLEGAPHLETARAREVITAIMPEKNREGYEQTNDTDFAYEIPGLARFRVNVFTDRKGTGAVLRVIPAKILTAEQLNLPEAVLKLCHIPKGLVLVTGPTGSGKSTTLAAMVDYINRTRTDHIITIEDPIEFVHDNHKCLVNQREIHNHTDGFKPALRAALREDPDIVLVGEMRDLETIAIAMETAETGHLVFGTLHTTTACSTVDRIIDQFPADRQSQIRTMLSESLRGVVAQTLLKKLEGGRVAALEVLIVSPAISNLIREAKTFQIPSLMQTGKKQGMTLLNDALLELVTKKIVAPEEAYSKAVDKTGFRSALTKAGINLKVDNDSDC
jgi:twitching motility protein PilT